MQTLTRKHLSQSLENVEWRPANFLDSYADVFVRILQSF